MAKKSGSLKAKRSGTPPFWKISRKDKRFVVRTEPGPHPKQYSYPLLVLLRDVLSLGRTNRDVMSVLNAGKVSVDGRVIKSPRFPIGLMDIVEVEAIGKSYRIVPYKGGLAPVEIPSKEKNLKILMVKSKRTLKGAKAICGLHDGRMFFPSPELEINRGDSCLLKVPSQEFQASYRLAKGGHALLIKGERSGEIVTIEDLKTGTFARSSISTIKFQDGTSSELPTSSLMALGKQPPGITLSGIGQTSLRVS